MPGTGSQAGRDHLLNVALPGLLDRRQLQVLLGAEVGEQPALAHGQLAGQPPDAEAVQPSTEARSAAARRIVSRVWAPWLLGCLGMNSNCIARTIVLLLR